MLRTIKQSGFFRPVAILACSAALLSFSYRLGSDHFTISINGTKLIEQYVATKSPAKVIYLDKYNAEDKVSIYYSHCGKIGSSRTVLLKDSRNNTLKEWSFSDSQKEAEMTFKMKDIMTVQHANKSARLSLYYKAGELDKAMLLAGINSSQASTASVTVPDDAFADRKTSLLNK
ncbi:hypothetical protein [Flavihumibacter solisilvae]|uniref:Uncharacterized protein n=1 Tax=Flavihumibacter solisilvae TaxID=1349421 RepID=A0A0C1IM78_9BACT|nr:hypothetical protein [Flavihumibacter solisilvae]KIC95355.1 hypothetical protein OI18_07085 [Flavihumibacter solisilvae]